MGSAHAQLDQGSFRDRDGRVYLYEDRVFRGLSASAFADFQAVEKTRFYQEFSQRGQLVGTQAVEAGQLPLPAPEQAKWSAFLEHQKIPLVSYPYEWTFGMLQSAALLQLDLTEAAVSAGFAVKDATPYNIQFVQGQPVFIDIASFEKLEAGAPWSAYRQFCEMFLFPLLLQAYKGIDFQAFLRARIDGIGLQEANRLFSFRDRFRKGVLTNVWLQAKLDRRYGNTATDVRSDLKSAGFRRELILANVRKLRKLVKSLTWDGDGSEWGDYAQFHNYSEADHQCKEQFIEQCVSGSHAHTVWDIGCNTGQFSRLAAKHCQQVLATDVDHLAVERLYRDDLAPGNILPLVQNVADPSPNWGWRLRERRDLPHRAQPDMIFCLALIHHVVITANVPLAEFVGWLSTVTEHLVIEYVSRKDDKVQALLRNKDDNYADYSRSNLEHELGRYFEIRGSILLRDGMRQIYWCSKCQDPEA